MPYIGFVPPDGGLGACWLTQDINVIGTSEVVAEVGFNGVTYSTGFVGDSGVTFLSSPTVLGRWQTPNGVGQRVAVDIPNTNWRAEAWVRFSGSADNTGDFIEISPVGGAVGSYHAYFGWGSSGLSQVLMANWSTTYSSGGGSVNTTMTRPNATDWYHIMFQNNSVAKNFVFYVSGRSVWAHGGGATQCWDAGTSLEVAFRTTLGSPHNWGGACIRCGLPESAMYAYTGVNDLMFTPPTSRLQDNYLAFLPP